MTKPIDWSKPIEAYHPDGRVVAVEVRFDFGWPASSVNVSPPLDDGDTHTFKADGSHYAANVKWRIRNIEQEPPLCERTLRRVLDAMPEHAGIFEPTSFQVGYSSGIIAYREQIAKFLPKDRAKTLVEEWGADPISAAVARDFARWLIETGRLKDA